MKIDCNNNNCRVIKEGICQRFDSPSELVCDIYEEPTDTTGKTKKTGGK